MVIVCLGQDVIALHPSSVVDLQLTRFVIIKLEGPSPDVCGFTVLFEFTRDKPLNEGGLPNAIVSNSDYLENGLLILV